MWWMNLQDVHSILHAEAPDSHKDSIFTHEIMRNPWMIRETGGTFEYKPLYDWVVCRKKRRDPQTSEGFSEPDLIHAKGLQRDIRNWCEDKAAALRKENVRLGTVEQQRADAREGGQSNTPHGG